MGILVIDMDLGIAECNCNKEPGERLLSVLSIQVSKGCCIFCAMARVKQVTCPLGLPTLSNMQTEKGA